jgi:hypothetical protein
MYNPTTLVRSGGGDSLCEVWSLSCSLKQVKTVGLTSPTVWGRTGSGGWESGLRHFPAVPLTCLLQAHLLKDTHLLFPNSFSLALILVTIAMARDCIGLLTQHLWRFLTVPKSVVASVRLGQNSWWRFCSRFETGSHHEVQAGLKLEVLLPQLPECWNCRHEPQCLAIVMEILPFCSSLLRSNVCVLNSRPRLWIQAAWAFSDSLSLFPVPSRNCSCHIA